jgi:hypothetical protein
MAIVAVQDFRREEKDNIDDLLNKVGKGLQIAQAVYGFKTAGEQSDLRKLQIAEAERKSKTEKLQSELMDRGIYTQDQVVENKLVTFKTKNDLAKAVGEDTWEGAVKKYPALEANIFRLNVATPKQIITEKTGEMVGIDDLGRTEKIAPAIIKPETIQDYDVNAFDAVIPRDVLEKFTQGKVGGAIDEMTFREKFMPLDEETFQRIPSEISSLREKVPVLVDGTVVNRWGVRRSSVRPTTPYQAIQIEKAGIELGKVREEEAKRVKIKDLSKVGIVADEDFDKNYISVDSPEALQKRTPSLFKNLPEGAVEKFTVEDLDTGIQVEKYGIRRETWDNALSIAKQEKLLQEKPSGVNDKSLYVKGVGTALTKQNAKELTNGITSYVKLRRQLDEMIALREKYGTESLNRTAVERGKQLSNDILLSYKNIAKLGVLSQADEKIINSIIPRNPLEFNIGALGVGKDSTLERMKSWRQDLRNDFEFNINQKIDEFEKEGALKDIENVIQQSSKQISEVEKKPVPSGYIRVQKGNEILDIPAELLPEAEKDGYKLIK